MFIKPVVLCGGQGTRLWPLSRETHPKQYICLYGASTLLQGAMTRLANLEMSQLPPTVICNEEHRFFAAEQLRELNMEAEFILEPVGRDTAPAIAVPALLALKEDPILLVMPADHLILDDKAFTAAVQKAALLADTGKLVTFGTPPYYPHTGFGYIHCSQADSTGCKVDKFVEKPDAKTAKKYLDSGDYFWNSGIFMFRASTFISELKRFAPEILKASQAAIAASRTDPDFMRLDKDSFVKCPAISVDYAIMEKTDKCAMVAMETKWNDLGSWNAIYDISDKDDNGNATKGDVVSIDTSNCLLQSDRKLLTTLGVDNLVVIETADAVLVANRDNIQDIKKLVSCLKEQNRCEAIEHNKIYRPWGAYETTISGKRFQVKKITVNPGQALSLQLHHHRAEHWVVVRGTAKVQNGEKEILLHEDQSTYISLGHVHRLENPGKIPLELIEVQTGSYLGEDDIVRLCDEYGRIE